MERTVILIRDMDCPSEEQLIRLKLSSNSAIRQLGFDIENRRLTVLHEGGLDGIVASISSLDLGEEVVETGVSSGDAAPGDGAADRTLLVTVLLINFSVFVIEITAGLIAGSMGLVADSLDELADAFVYGLGILSISGSLVMKQRIARSSGVLQLILASWGFYEIVRRFLGDDPAPSYVIMIVFSIVALSGNIASLYFLRKSRSDEVHIKATQIFTTNDILVNIGVIVAAVLVAVLQSNIPDLVVGAVVFVIVLRGALKIFQLAK